MANLNLSQFTEKLFVADADHTFIWDSAASISKRVSRNSWLNSGTLTSDAPVTISQTWNNAAVAFTGLKFNAAGTSGTNSASGSLLADFQVNGVSQFSVSKVGAMISAFSISSSYIQSNANFVLTTDAGAVVWGATSDTWLRRDAANTLALRNGANAQTFNVYGTYTSITDYRRLTVSCDNTTGNATITANKGSATTGDVGTVSINGVPVGLKGASFSVAVGAAALSAAGNTGTQNTAVGVNALIANSTGGFNSAIGTNSLAQNTSGSNNVGVGSQAGDRITGGSTINAISNNSVYLGVESRANASNETNQIVIGYQATGIGSNSVVLGNDSITKTALKGNVGIGTTSPSSKLQVTGGDVEIETVTSGIIMKAAGTSTRYRITLNATGDALVFTAI